MRVLYSIFIYLYTLGIHIFACCNHKACLWVKGRRGWRSTCKNALAGAAGPRVWFHASSLGEFEQGRPVMEAFRAQYPHVKIVLTFFSPSGYEIRKNYIGADFICYLPADTPAQSRAFVEIIKPDAVFFIKYEYWFNYLQTLHKKAVPVYFIAAVYRPEQWFFKWYGTWALNHLKNVSGIFVQNESSCLLLAKQGLKNVIVSGDTRFDRVLTIAANKKDLPLIHAFAAGSDLIVAGSTWPADDDILIKFITQKPKGVKFIIVPHDIHNNYIDQLLPRFKCKAQRYSALNEELAPTTDVIVLDSVGLLSSLYAYARIAYIGGGFGKGIHNILEAACYGVPVLFGPHCHKFDEALKLTEAGGAFVVNDAESLERTFSKLLNDQKYHSAVSEICRFFVIKNSGATRKITESLAPVFDKMK